MDLGKYYEDFGITKVTNRKVLAKQKLRNLYKKPIKDTGVNMPHVQVFAKDNTHQADLLFMPTDNEYKYILVVVDCYSRLVDAVPLKFKDSADVLAAFQEIYARGPLKQPKRMQVDSGTEFKGDVKKYFTDAGVFFRAGLPGRSRMQALAERANQNIGTALMKRMSAQELLTHQLDTQWVADLPVVIKALNKRTEGKTKPYPDHPVCSGSACKLIPVGTLVRVVLDKPRELVTNAKLHGRFRDSDLRWDPVVHVVRQILLKPGQPPMYLVDGTSGPNKILPVAYTRNQLQIIPPDEQYPDKKVIRGTPDTYVIEKLIDRRKHKGRIQFLVKWAGHPADDNSWEPRTEIKKVAPVYLEAYEKKII
jgi:hypothetical protein